MKFGEYFEYNKQSTGLYGLMLADFDGRQDEIESGLSRSTIKGSTTKYRKQANHLGISYDNALEFELTLIKDPRRYSSDQRRLQFTRSEMDAIMRWLTSPTNLDWLRIYNADEENFDEEIVYLGIFTKVEFCAAGGIYGVKLTFECDSPYGYTPEIKRTYASTALSPCSFTINNRSSESEDYIYPYLELTATGTDSVTITNHTEGQSVTYQNLKPDQTLCVDNKLARITALEDTHFISLDTLGLSGREDLYWLRFVDGFNKLSLTGDARLLLKYREIRKVGAY